MLSLSESEAAFRSGVVAAPTRRDVVIVDGPEAASYLHGQVSQNIEALSIGGSAWTLLLEPTGRVTAWARVTRVDAEQFWLDVDGGAGEAMMARLERFKLRTKASFALQANVPVLALRGPDVPTLDAVRAAVAASPSAAAVVVADLCWPASQGLDLIGLDHNALDTMGDDLVSLLGSLAAPEITDIERIESGRPAMGFEFGEKTIPAETGVVEASADFTKGCYVGQELVARVDSRGNNTPRRVHPASSQSSRAPEPGADVMLDGEPVGTVTSAIARTNGVAVLVSLKRGIEAPVTVQAMIDGTATDIDVTPVHWA